MRYALQLARNAAGFARPNPMVGAVIVAPGDRIIGRGWTQPWGGPHAEVMAVRSVKPEDLHLLEKSTIYVTLEPCSHYGKTPPCAQMLIDKKIPKIVIGTLDPFEKVSGRGVKMLRDAGREVVVGVLKDECDFLNRRFMTAHRLQRPWIELKWAETADGVMGLSNAQCTMHNAQCEMHNAQCTMHNAQYEMHNAQCTMHNAQSEGATQSLKISTPLSLTAMHKDRAMADAIMVGTGTAIADRPSLTVRFAECRANPMRITFDRHGRLPKDLFREDNDLIITDSRPLSELMSDLYANEGITSLIVEGGPTLLRSFLAAGLWDELRIERSDLTLADLTLAEPDTSSEQKIAAPDLPSEAVEFESVRIDRSTVKRYRRQTDN